MATATKTIPRAPRSKGAGTVSQPTALSFAISRDNGGGYLWEILGGDGEVVAQSAGFVSRDDAERAAHYVHDSARLAHFVQRDPAPSEAAGI